MAKKKHDPIVEYRTEDGKKAFTARGSADHIKNRDREVKARPARAPRPVERPVADVHVDDEKPGG
ncbi:hypothetical protein [Tomitella gaofuii]|uniref:hypothetical protein n=1 Tax=Tomitella gaofuii TaxID=2760083 RepID=UPI0015FA661D|nr:hypothetical protein [Tomitella gaofuii]